MFRQPYIQVRLFVLLKLQVHNPSVCALLDLFEPLLLLSDSACLSLSGYLSVFVLWTLYPPTNLRIVITAGYIIESHLGIVVIVPIAEGILIAHGVAGGVGNGALAPGVVAVLSHDLPRGGPGDGNDIPLQVVEVIIQRVAIGEAHPLARAVVEEQHGGIPGLLGQDIAVVVF